ncbi:SET and MYND domain-containing protein 4-like [Macrobrachium rosenbergii]|uniref:SET and MYND domain-containing protein 4-like n=1 Tax=Macrobrachium rosenbergii TaxID=79674 RepID=UPI0034D4891C
MMEGREEPGLGASEDEIQRYLHSMCSDATLFDRKTGFFTHFIEQIDAQVSDAFFKKFGSLKTDEARILDTWAIKPVHTLKIESMYKEKVSDQAEYFRTKGNRAFQDKDDKESLVMYSRAIMQAPCNSEECLSLSYANRSAVLFHLGKYQLCLNDIELAVEAGYPSNLMYKVLDRRGQCLVKLGKHSQALEAFHAADSALSDSTLEEKKMEAWKKDLAKKAEQCQDKTDKETEVKTQEGDDSLFAGKNPIIPNASAAVGIEESKEAGRYAVVTRPVGSGQVLFSEKPYAFVLHLDRTGTHCHHCAARLVAPVACKWCSAITFCSKQCRDESLESYHRWECKSGELLRGSGMSLNSSLALRLITLHDLEFFKELKPRLEEPARLPSEKNPHRPDDYVSVYNMVALPEKRSPEDFLERSLMACFLLKVLQRMHFFGRWDEESPPDKELTEDEVFIGSLLLRHLQILQFNSHEVTGVGFAKDKVNFKEAKNISLGLALYPTISFCNHSCYPAVARFFKGTKMVVLNLRPLKAGEVVAENYGPVFTHHEIQQRQRKLLSRYWFTCACEACKNDWPVYQKMAFKRRFRCQTCSAGFGITDPSKTQIKCPGCNTQVNVKDTMNVISKAEESYLLGKMHLDASQKEEAIKSFLSYADTITKYTVPPVKELHLSLQHLRLLLAARGTIQIRNPLN